MSNCMASQDDDQDENDLKACIAGGLSRMSKKQILSVLVKYSNKLIEKPRFLLLLETANTKKRRKKKDIYMNQLALPPHVLIKLLNVSYMYIS